MAYSPPGAGRGHRCPAEDGDAGGALADDGPGHVHGGVAGADDDDPLSQVVAVGIVEIVDGEMDMAEGLALDAQAVRLPHAGADEYGFVSVGDEVVYGDGEAMTELGRIFFPISMSFLRYLSRMVLGQSEVGNPSLMTPPILLRSNMVTSYPSGQDDGNG